MSSTSVSENKLYEHLKSELNKRSDLKQAKQILEKIDIKNDKNKDNEYNMIYRFKLEKSRGDSLFSSLNDPSGNIGSALGVRSSTYLDQVKRYHMSKELVSEATVYQRNLIRGFTNMVVRNVWRHKSNYLVKAGLSSIFLYNLCKANENKNLFKLRKQAPATTSEIASFYYNTGVSFLFAFIAFAYI